VFAIGSLCHFALKYLKGADQPVTRVSWENHIVDVTALGRKKRI
jgi:hypothetical protein